MAYLSAHLPALVLELAETINSIEKGTTSLNQRVNVTYNSDSGILQVSGDFPATKIVGAGKVSMTPSEYLTDSNFDVTGTPIASAAPAGVVSALVLACEAVAAAEDAKLAANQTLPAGVGVTVTYPVVNNLPVFRVSASLAFAVDTSTGSPKFVATNHLV